MVKLLKTHKTFDGQTQFWEHDSKSTQTTMKFSTFTPSMNPVGCLIWLSGLTCTDENFISKAGAQKYLNEHRLMVVCPDTSPRGLNLPHEHESYDFGSGASFYVDATTEFYRDHYRMETYIVHELHELMQDEFKISPGAISITGHSMGGHGALILGLKHPSKFKSISAFSPIVNPVMTAWGRKAFAGYLGDSPNAWLTSDATELVKNGAKHERAILIDQGLGDEFFEKQLLTQNFVHACHIQSQSLTANLREGYDHSYYFIASFIESHIKFHAASIGSTN